MVKRYYQVVPGELHSAAMTVNSVVLDSQQILIIHILASVTDQFCSINN